MNQITSVTKKLASPSVIKEVVKKRSWWEILKSHFRRVPLEILNFLTKDHDWLFWLVGFINKRFGFIESVFLVYPAREDYALYYFYPCRIKKHYWQPGPAGLLWQDGKLTIMFAIAASNGQYTDPKNVEKIRYVNKRMEELRQLIGAKRKTFAGILPGILYLKRIVHEAPEADLTAVAVVQAIDLVKARESLQPDTPVVVLGGRGFIGRRVVKLLDKSTTYSIDPAGGQDKSHWPDHLYGQRIIVVNITLNNAIRDYLDVIWPGTVVVNEVYPEPTPEILERLRERNCDCYHIAGVKAWAWPAFPSAYQGAIPCCAAWPSPRFKAVVRRIN